MIIIWLWCWHLTETCVAMILSDIFTHSFIMCSFLNIMCLLFLIHCNMHMTHMQIKIVRPIAHYRPTQFIIYPGMNTILQDSNKSQPFIDHVMIMTQTRSNCYPLSYWICWTKYDKYENINSITFYSICQFININLQTSIKRYNDSLGNISLHTCKTCLSGFLSRNINVKGRIMGFL